MTQQEQTNESSSTLFDDEPLLGLLNKNLEEIKDNREQMVAFVTHLSTLRMSPQTLRAKLEDEADVEEGKPKRNRKTAAPVNISDYLNL